MRRFSTKDHLPLGYSQQILLDEQGRLVISCDSIFSAQSFQQSSLLSVSPFLESIFPVLQNLTITDPSLYFPKVETDLDLLPGTYDYYFSRIQLEEGDYILWSIYDYTKVYEDFRRFQQRRNELQVHRQQLEFRLQEFKRQEDLFQLNQEITATNVSKSESISQLEEPLSSPFNILDGFNWMLMQAATTPQNYVYALEDILQQLMESVIQLRHHLKPAEWSQLEGSLRQQTLGNTGFKWDLSAELKSIPAKRFPYLGVILQQLVKAFAHPGLNTRLVISLETTNEGFEKGNAKLDVTINDLTETQQMAFNFKQAELQIYLLRSLVHQAGGLLQVVPTDVKSHLHLNIQLPVLPL